VGAVLDFWRVEAYEPDRLLRLRVYALLRIHAFVFRGEDRRRAPAELLKRVGRAHGVDEVVGDVDAVERAAHRVLVENVARHDFQSGGAEGPPPGAGRGSGRLRRARAAP
jgi:hypothetical protein